MDGVVLADVLSEDTVLKWYQGAHSAKGKSVFLEQMKSFVEWLQSAEEGELCWCIIEEIAINVTLFVIFQTSPSNMLLKISYGSLKTLHILVISSPYLYHFSAYDKPVHRLHNRVVNFSVCHVHLARFALGKVSPSKFGFYGHVLIFMCTFCTCS